MKQWTVLYQKEMLEMWRSGKWLWVPVVCILLMAMNPVIAYYMPQIIDKAGNLPEGSIIQIPVPVPAQVMSDTLAQFSTMGILVLVLATMGIVSSERANGMSAMILVKPVKPLSYLTAKWAGMLTLMVISFSVGYASSWYYTEMLIGPVKVAEGLVAFGIYAVWLGFILTITLFMSTWLKGNGSVAFVTLLVTAVISLSSGLLPRFMAWSPGRLSGHAYAILSSGEALPSLFLSASVTLLLIAGALLGAVHIIGRQELAD